MNRHPRDSYEKEIPSNPIDPLFVALAIVVGAGIAYQIYRSFSGAPEKLAGTTQKELVQVPPSITKSPKETRSNKQDASRGVKFGDVNQVYFDNKKPPSDIVSLMKSQKNVSRLTEKFKASSNISPREFGVMQATPHNEGGGVLRTGLLRGPHQNRRLSDMLHRSNSLQNLQKQRNSPVPYSRKTRISPPSSSGSAPHQIAYQSDLHPNILDPMSGYVKEKEKKERSKAIKLMEALRSSPGRSKMTTVKGKDGKEYDVADLQNKQKAADYLAEINRRVDVLMYHLQNLVAKNNKIEYEGENMTNCIKRLIRKQQNSPHKFSELYDDTDTVASNTNKGEQLDLCLRDKADPSSFNEMNTAMRVVLHELAHSADKQYRMHENHGNHFYRLHSYLMDEAGKVNVYSCSQYNRDGPGFCGMLLPDDLAGCNRNHHVSKDSQTPAKSIIPKEGVATLDRMRSMLLN